MLYCKLNNPEVDSVEEEKKLAQCPYESQTCCSKKRNIMHYKANQCGFHDDNGVGYIFSNRLDESAFGEFPWMAALLVENEDDEFVYKCGGSLIDPNVILTAAHCVNNFQPEGLKVRLGEWDTQTTNEILPHSDHEVSKIIIHPNFIQSNLYNDVALLILSKPAKLRAHINTICLPPKNHRFDKRTCFASGWGADKYGQKGAYRVNLKKIKLPLVQLSDCEDKLRATELGERFRLSSSFMCAGGEANVDTCTGDGGELENLI